MSEERRWHIEKGIPLSVITAIVFQTGGFVWYAANMMARVDSLERQMSATSWQAERIIRIDERLNNVQNNVSEIKDMLQDKQRI